MMRRLITIGLILATQVTEAQQLPQYSQYMLNELAINPAVSGKDEFADVRSNSRQQWVGITDAPRTYMLTLHGPVAGKNMGIGMNLFTDIVGPTRRTGLSFSYAYHLKLNEELNLSFGLSAGVLQWGIDGNKVTLREEGDSHFLTTYQNTIVPDFGSGLYFYKKNKFYVGLSVPQMYQAPLNLYPGSARSSRIVSQVNLNGAYVFELSDDLDLEPSALIKYEYPVPPKIDVGVRGIFRDMVWLGAVYRHNDALCGLVGYMYRDYLMIGYSYDFTTTALRRYNSGTHELMLGLRFSRRQAATWGNTK